MESLLEQYQETPSKELAKAIAQASPAEVLALDPEYVEIYNRVTQ